MPSSSTALRTVAFGLAFLAACREPAPYDQRRVSLDGRPGESLSAGGVTRTGLKLPADKTSIAMNLDELTTGRLTLFVAPSGEAAPGGSVEVVLHETGWRSWTGTSIRQRCVLRWGEPGTPVDAPWQACSFDLPRSIPSARLELSRGNPVSGDIQVSEVRLDGNGPRFVPSVFILLLDALRFDSLRPFRPDAALGHHMEALARDSVVLHDLRSSSSWTRPAVATLFTGMRADRHRVVDRGDVLDTGFHTLAEMLQTRGYSTAAWSSNPNVLPVWGLAQGFDVFVDEGSGSWLGGKTDGAALVSRLQAAIASRGAAPLFYYAHLMDPHAPYQPSKEQRDLVHEQPDTKASFPRPLAILSVPNDWTAFVDYKGEVLDSDDHVGSFVRALKEAGLYDDSLVVVLSDHGEEFLDHGGRDHGRTLYEEVLRVPALIKLPRNRLAGSVVKDSLSLVDLLPTLLSELRMETPPGLDGTTITLESPTQGPARPSVASLGLDGHRQSSIYDPPWKLIRNDALGRIELYNLANDPRERFNQLLWHPEVRQRLEGALDVMMSHGQEGWHVLVCGTQEEATLRLALRPSSGTVETFRFEKDEVVPPSDPTGAWSIRPMLTPTTAERAIFGKLAKITTPEQVEMLVTPQPGTESSTLEIRSEDDSTFDYRTTAGEMRSAAQITFDSGSQEIAVPQGGRLECASTEKPGTKSEPPAKPFLRVWYVPPVQKVATEDLDPAMVERLRALGYLQ
jgi:arylsulfatase A-like enzyme